MARNNGLDTPRETRRSIRPNYDPEAFGRLSERFARFLGTARFLVYMTVFIAFWIIWNFVAPADLRFCLLYTSPSPRDGLLSRMPSSA